MNAMTAAGMTLALKNKGFFSGGSRKPKNSLLGAADGTPKKKAKPKKPATGYRQASKSTIMK